MLWGRDFGIFIQTVYIQKTGMEVIRCCGDGKASVLWYKSIQRLFFDQATYFIEVSPVCTIRTSMRRLHLQPNPASRASLLLEK